MLFDWDQSKAEGNLIKHRVAFEDAVRIFHDDALTIEELGPDPYGGQRFRAMGQADGRAYSVVYTPREEVLRIISARRASRKERRRHA